MVTNYEPLTKENYSDDEDSKEKIPSSVLEYISEMRNREFFDTNQIRLED